MKKILWIVNPLSFQESDIQFPFYLSELIKGEILVCFRETGLPDAIPVMSDNTVFPTVDYRVVSEPVLMTEKKNEALIGAHNLIRGFFTARNKSISFNKDSEMLTDDIISASRFADVMITKTTSVHATENEQVTTDEAERFLTESYCPVLLAPDEMSEIKSIILTYNGSYSSVYAIKQFAYIFNTLKDVPVEVLTITERGKDHETPEKELIHGFLSSHFNNISYKIIKGDPETEIMLELMYKKNAIVTFGAFGRNRISRMIRPSDAAQAIRYINIPIFVTHP